MVITTPSGYASALAQAIDEGMHPGVAGTVAGDNTIFVAARDGTSAVALRDELPAICSKEPQWDARQWSPIAAASTRVASSPG